MLEIAEAPEHKEALVEIHHNPAQIVEAFRQLDLQGPKHETDESLTQPTFEFVPLSKNVQFVVLTEKLNYQLVQNILDQQRTSEVTQ